MTTVTATAPVATPVAAPTVESFAAPLSAALAAVTASSNANGQATATLHALTLDAYRAAIASTPGATGTRDDGHVVLFDNAKSYVASTVIAAATGMLALPSAKDRTKGETSLGQYLSRIARVATDLTDGGVGALDSFESYVNAYDTITGDAAARKNAAADRAFTVWLSGLNKDDAAAITRTIALIGHDSADDHRAAFIRAIKPVK